MFTNEATLRVNDDQSPSLRAESALSSTYNSAYYQADPDDSIVLFRRQHEDTSAPMQSTLSTRQQQSSVFDGQQGRSTRHFITHITATSYATADNDI